MMHDNLLGDELISVRGRGGVRRLSLPGVLAGLERDEILDFPALRPHQRHPWHAFLCQLAVMAAERAGLTALTPDMDEGRWRTLLRGLTPDFPADEPWRLVVADLSKPAFLQPPVPEGSCAGWGPKDADRSSPFALDVLVTAKEHGEKDRDGAAAAPEDWIIGLMMLQTFSGYLGRGNYGVSRQNGGHASRPGVSLVFSTRPGPRFARDCRILLTHTAELRLPEIYPPAGGIELLWLPPWKGEAAEALPLQKLHPLYIEICRRVRLICSNNRMHFVAKKSCDKGVRINAKNYNGVLGDPWIPVNKGDAKADKAYNDAPRYAKIYPVLFDQERFKPALLQCFQPGDPPGDAAVLFRVFKREQGGSEGYFERLVPIPAPCRHFCAQDVNAAARVAREMEAKANKIQEDGLRPAIALLLQGAPKEKPDKKQKETQEWAKKFAQGFDDRVDAEFFRMLWAALGGRNAEGDVDLEPWRAFLEQAARRTFKAAVRAAPSAGALRWRAVAKAEILLNGCLRKNLPAPQKKEAAQ